jgi:hypothetical protein
MQRKLSKISELPPCTIYVLYIQAIAKAELVFITRGLSLNFEKDLLGRLKKTHTTVGIR